MGKGRRGRKSEEWKGTRYQNRLQGTPGVGLHLQGTKQQQQQQQQQCDGGAWAIGGRYSAIDFTPTPCQKQPTPPWWVPPLYPSPTTCLFPPGPGVFAVAGAPSHSVSSLLFARSLPWGGSAPSSPLSGGCGFGRIPSAATVSSSTSFCNPACDHRLATTYVRHSIYHVNLVHFKIQTCSSYDLSWPCCFWTFLSNSPIALSF
jgi:hypothetical protein